MLLLSKVFCVCALQLINSYFYLLHRNNKLLTHSYHGWSSMWTGSVFCSTPLFSATTITVVLSELTRWDVASFTSLPATSWGSYSVKHPCFKKYFVENSMHSSEENRSKSPSLASTRKSSDSGFNVVILISGSFRTKSCIVVSCVFSSVIVIYLHSKSPNALVTASLPSTRPKTM